MKFTVPPHVPAWAGPLALDSGIVDAPGSTTTTPTFNRGERVIAKHDGLILTGKITSIFRDTATVLPDAEAFKGKAARTQQFKFSQLTREPTV